MTGQPGRKRNEASSLSILQATAVLMEELGFENLSIEGVAARAGVSKATIYRWWPSKGVLAVEAFLNVAEPLIAFPQSASTKDDILQQMHALAALYRGPTGRFVSEMIGASQHDPGMRNAFSTGFLEPRREQAKSVFRRGVASGELRPDVDIDVAIDALYAPIYYRMLVSSAPLDDDFIAAHTSLVLQSLILN